MATDYMPQNTIEKLCEALTRGNFRTVACAFAGLRFKVFEEWMAAGEKEDGLLTAADLFRRRVVEAETQAEMDAVDVVRSSGDPKQLQWLLASRFPKRWGKKEPKKEIKESERLNEELNRQAADKLMQVIEAIRDKA